VTQSDASYDPDEPVGVVLARMRRAKGLTGGELGRLAGMSQPKVSRIENGRGVPDSGDIGRLALALGADEVLARQLVERAETSQNRMTDWRPSPIGLAGSQREVARWEAATGTLRCFDPIVVPGLLQTSEYARSMLTTFQKYWVPDLGGSAASAVLEAVSARVRRQEILSDESKSFHFVVTEAVLKNQFCPPEDMVGQIRRLRELTAEYDNVSVRILPDHAKLAIPPLHGFELFDDRQVSVDLFNTGLSSYGRSDARLYRGVFDVFEAESLLDIDPILDKYNRYYAARLLADDPETPGQRADS
jgi:transcriptional regulator with XRE-family HTH domain